METNDPYYKQHAAELQEIGVSEQDWIAMENREARVRALVSKGFSHCRATEIVYGIDLSTNKD